MIENLPLYVSIVFGLTALITVSFIYKPLQRLSFSSTFAKIVMFLIPFWMLFQSALAIMGFYLNTSALPPRLPVFAVFPSFLTIIFLFVLARKDLISRLPLRTLTLLSIIRIPGEFVLLWLYQNGQVPQLMTFEGRNFDILSGITAPFIAWLAFRGAKVNRPLLLTWNILALILLINIVTIAVLSARTPFQQLAFDQPNVGVLYFPFIWLPSIVVPIVFFTHFVSIYQLLKKNN